MTTKIVEDIAYRDRVFVFHDRVQAGKLLAHKLRESRAPKKVIVAVPTASLGATELLAPEVDEIVCLNIRSGRSFAVADAYENWYDLTDEEVINILKRDSETRYS